MKKEDVLQYIIEQMQPGEEFEYLDAVRRGCARIRPEEEIVCISLPARDEAARWEILQQAVPMLAKVPKNPFAK